MDFTPYFKQYEALVASAEKAFEQVRGMHPEAVTCGGGCADCCHALFDITFVEAMYINAKFNETFSGADKHEILELANRADRKTYQIKREAMKAQKAGASDVEILGRMAEERVRCPLLGREDLCVMYDARPITCRLYGIPTSTAGISHTCGKSKFEEGTPYPTVNMDVLFEKLGKISRDMVAAMESKYTNMGEMLVPLSMALLTDYNEEYLGLAVEDGAREEAP